jgi:hypothetical protein
VESFYNEFGIKQYNSFSGGFRYHEKVPAKVIPPKMKNELNREDLYRELGLSKKGNQVDYYKIDNDYVP